MDFSFHDTLSILQRTPGVLDLLLRNHSPELAHANYGPNTWSAYEVLGHLIMAETDDWIPRIRHILTHADTTPFPPFPHTATIAPSSGRSLNHLLDEFAKLRRASLKSLASFNLTPSDFPRRGLHPSLGPVTLAQLFSTWSTHDLHHTRQICQAMAFQSRHLVGPWRAYLNTLPPTD